MKIAQDTFIDLNEGIRLELELGVAQITVGIYWGRTVRVLSWLERMLVFLIHTFLLCQLFTLLHDGLVPMENNPLHPFNCLGKLLSSSPPNTMSNKIPRNLFAERGVKLISQSLSSIFE